MKSFKSAAMALFVTLGAMTLNAQTVDYRFGQNATTLGMETLVSSDAPATLQRYVDQWGNPASVGVAGGRWESLASPNINTLDFGVGKFGFRTIDLNRMASIGMDLEVGTTCGGTDNAGQRGGVSIKPLSTRGFGIVHRGTFYSWQVDYVITACSNASQITLRAHPIEWVHGRKSKNIPIDTNYIYNGKSQTNFKVGDMKAGEMRLITMTVTGTVPPALEPGSPLYLNGAWYGVAVINGERQYKLYQDPIVAVVQ